MWPDILRALQTLSIFFFLIVNQGCMDIVALYKKKHYIANKWKGVLHMAIDEELCRNLVVHQENEITEYHIYTRLARKVGDPHNRQVLEGIANDELRHYNIWQAHTRHHALSYFKELLPVSESYTVRGRFSHCLL